MAKKKTVSEMTDEEQLCDFVKKFVALTEKYDLRGAVVSVIGRKISTSHHVGRSYMEALGLCEIAKNHICNRMASDTTESKPWNQ